MNESGSYTLAHEVARLLRLVANGSGVTVASVKHVARTGMSRIIHYEIFYVEPEDPDGVSIFNLTHAIHMLGVDVRTSYPRPYGVRVKGGGQDMIHDVLYRLWKLLDRYGLMKGLERNAVTSYYEF